MLDVAHCRGGEVDERGALVSYQIAVRVLGKDELARSQGNQGTALNDGNTARVDDVVQEGGGLVHAPVTIRVLEYLDPADGLVFTGSVHVHHVGLEFTNPEASLEVELGKHRVLDHGSGGHELNPETGCDLEALQSLLRREQGGGVGRPFAPVGGVKQVLVLFLLVPTLAG